MRNLLIASGLGLTLLASACDNGPGAMKDPPVLKITSPERSLIQDHTGPLQVTGTVAPNINGTPVSQVTVNGVAATVNADGTFTATVDVKPGAMLIHTEARDADGGKAEDTRSVEAGDLRAPGSPIENAITTAISANAFAKISDAAGPLIKGMDMKSMLAPMQPMVHTGDENGEDCLFARLFVDDFKMTDVKLSLVPVNGGLQFSAELDGLDVPGHMRYAAACISGSNNIEIKADSVIVRGTLTVTPDGDNGFKTDLKDETVQLQNLDITASGIPGTILDLLPLDTAIQYIAPYAAKLFMGPMMNQALGALGGPQQLNVLGKTIDLQVAPSAISFDPSGALVTLDMNMLIEGTEDSNGFVFTSNGMPAMDPGQGMQLGLADDLANELLSQLTATGMLNLSMPANGGSFDSNDIAMTSPPMISADPADGKMRLILPDMATTFTLQGKPVGKAAINATVDLQIVPSNNGYGVAIQLGTPDIHVDVLDDIPNETGFTNADLGKAVELVLGGQLDSIGALLGAIPLPSMAGLQMKNLSIGADEGYVMVQGTLE